VNADLKAALKHTVTQLTACGKVHPKIIIDSSLADMLFHRNKYKVWGELCLYNLTSKKINDANMMLILYNFY